MSLAVHNVGQLRDAEVVDRFVVREHELDELLGHLHEPDPRHHSLVVGARGMGKSLLLRRLAIAVAEEPDLAARWLLVTMAEELYDVTSNAELWLAALARVAEIVGDSDLAAQHRTLLAEPDPARLEELAFRGFLGAARARGLKVLLVVENLDMLLGQQLSDEEGASLRHAWLAEPDLRMLASAVTPLPPAYDGLFHRINLGPLDDNEVRTLWREVTGVDLAGDRTVPIGILTGGNPRLITELGRFSMRPDPGGLRPALDLLIDGYTPLFKATIEALPAVERKVFAALADIWSPATAAEVAHLARLDTSKVSALLGRLVHRGAVEIVEGEPGRRHYELTERLYNIYHLLRRPGGDDRARALLDILLDLYEPRDLNDTGAGEEMSPAPRATSLPVLESRLASLGDDDPETLLTRQEMADCIGESGDPDTAVTLYRQVLADQYRILGPDHPDTLTSRHQIAFYTGEAGDAGTALTLYRQLAADEDRILGPDHPDTLYSRHQIAYFTGETGDPGTALSLVGQVVADSTPWARPPRHPPQPASGRLPHRRGRRSPHRSGNQRRRCSGNGTRRGPGPRAPTLCSVATKLAATRDGGHGGPPAATRAAPG